MTLEERLWARVDKTDGCWWWTGAITGRGYGKMGTKLGGPKTHLTHRLAWEFAYGPIPEGMQVCHHCDHPLCVRPDHLFLGTQGDNMRDMHSKGRGASTRRSAETTHCVNGHEFNETNTYWRPDGFRGCRACRQEAVMRYRKRKATA